jgi:TetR/AcrR family transcriptional repressor of nem operon
LDDHCHLHFQPQGDDVMARTRQQKEESRQAIMRSAAKLFREKGFDRVTVAEVMDGAGLTHGGFPRHFASKDDLVTAALADVFKANQRNPMVPASSLAEFLDTYLQPEHRDAPGSGCPFAALGPEMARAPAATRKMLTETIEASIDAFARQAPGASRHEQRQAAIVAWATAIRAMMLARIPDDGALADEILAAGRSVMGASPSADPTTKGECR